MKGQKPDCENCIVTAYPTNQPIIDAWSETRMQCVFVNGKPIEVKHNAVIESLKRQGAYTPDNFRRVIELWHAMKGKLYGR